MLTKDNVVATLELRRAHLIQSISLLNELEEKLKTEIEIIDRNLK